MPAAPPFALSVAQILRDLGYGGLALLMFAETLFPPIPSEVVLPFAGYLVEQGEFTFAFALAAATLGSVTSSLVLYEMARRGGRPFAERFLKLARIGPHHLDRAEDWFDRRGAIVVLVGRFIPGVRSVVALPAGMLRMSRPLYAGLTLLGLADLERGADRPRLGCSARSGTSSPTRSGPRARRCSSRSPSPCSSRARGSACAAAATDRSELDRRVLRLEVLLDALVAALAAEARLLDAAERRRRVRDDALVQADHAGLERLARRAARA